jgi:hypothetical protein
VAFTNVWDNTFPPDTQLASLGAEDFRQTKLDIQERMSAFAVGILVNRPTPEAGFGQADNGVLYYAYDVGVLFQWDGTSWIDVRYNGVFEDLTQASIVPGAEVPLNTIVIPAGALKSGCQIDLFAAAKSVNGATAATFRVYIDDIVPAFDIPMAGIMVLGLTAHFVVLPNNEFFPLFVCALSDGTTKIICPGSSSLDPTAAVAIGTTIEVAAGAVLSEGLTAKVAL